MRIDETLKMELEGISESELKRFLDYAESHPTNEIQVDGLTIPYAVSGEGLRTILTFSGGWGGLELAYETVLGFETKNRIVVIDVSAFDDPDIMCRGINRILDKEGIERVVVTGQSFTGIIGQAYFKRNIDRVDGLILTNTIAPKSERCKKWALFLLKVFPFGLLKTVMKKKMGKLGRFEKEIPEDVKIQRTFVAALVGHHIKKNLTKPVMLNILKNVFAFNKRDEYTSEDFKGWGGRTLIITSEDDPYYPDVEIFMEYLPNAELSKFPTGYKHVSPQIHREEFHSVIQKFIDKL